MSENSPRNNRRYRTAYRRRENSNEDANRNDRYFTKGPLSPLRSPLNQKEGLYRNSEDRRQRRACWKELDKKEFVKFSLKDEDFPDLKSSRFTPEVKRDVLVTGKTAEGPKEGQDTKRYRRKLELSDNKKNARKFSRKESTADVEVEKDEVILKRRQKAIDYGKNTIVYDNYIANIKKSERKKDFPRTPDKMQKCSRRSWDQQVRLWKLRLHHWNNSKSSGQSMEGIFADTSSESASEVGDRYSTSSTPMEDYTSEVSSPVFCNDERSQSDRDCDEVESDVDNNSWAYQVAQQDENNFFDEFDLDLCLQEDVAMIDVQ